MYIIFHTSSILATCLVTGYRVRRGHVSQTHAGLLFPCGAGQQSVSPVRGVTAEADQWIIHCVSRMVIWKVANHGHPPHYVSLETCESRNRLVQCTLAVAGPFLNCQLSRWIDIDYRSLQTPRAFNQFKSQHSFVKYIDDLLPHIALYF